MKNILDYAGYLDLITKIVGWGTVLVSMWFLVRNIIHTTNGVYSFFAQSGLKWVSALHVVLICRKDRTNLTRLFIEYCVLTIKTAGLSKKEWKKKIYEFESSYVRNLHKTYVIKIENTFVLREENVRRRIEEYFSFLKKPQYSRVFLVNDSTYVSFLADIVVKEGYIAPLVQICSLQDRFNSDWSEILNHYVGEFGYGKNRYASEVSSFYTWLMWGPSVCITANDAAYKLCLYGLGDESMAVPLVLTEKSSSIWQEIKENLSKNKIGTFISGRFRLCDLDTYFEHKYDRFENNAIPFIDSMQLSENRFLLEENGESSVDQYIKSREYIFSAYVWIMLYYTEGEEKHTGFDCSHATVWFEHANIADNKNVELLTKTLVDKCITYFESIFLRGKYKERVYGIPWAINEYVKDALKKEIRKIQMDEKHPFHEAFMKQIDLDMAGIGQDTILSNIDDEFNGDGVTIKYTEIDFDNRESMGLLGRFYCELYVKEFPDENERESLDNMIKQAKRIGKEKECEYHCIIATMGNEIVGGIIGDYFVKDNSGVIEFVVVSPERRHQRIGTRLVSNLVDFFNADALNHNGKSKIDYYFFEVEDPKKMENETARNICEMRLAFWNKMNSKILGMKYIQPPLEKGKGSVDYLHLAICVINQELNYSGIDKEKVLSFLAEFFKYGFGIEDIKDCVELLKMRDDIEKTKEEKIKIIPISEVLNK